MKQKLGLASALVTRPRVLLLDEPTTGVDPVTRQDFWQLVIRLATQTEGVSVIISTPYMDEASRCHRVGFMKDGKIIAEDTPSNLRARLNNRVLELRGSPIGLLRHVAHKDRDVEDVQAFGDRLHIRVGENKAQDVLGRLTSQIESEGGRVNELRAVAPVLEDVFIALSETTQERRQEMLTPGEHS
jgi:ABC-2 type transport system ATP-binding protein